MSLDWVPDLPVGAVMVSYPPPLDRQTSLAQARRWCRQHRQAQVWVVTEQGELAGGLSQQQIDLACDHGLGADPLGRWLEPLPPVLSPADPLAAAIPHLSSQDGIPVVQGGRLLGVVRSREVWRCLAGSPPVGVSLRALPASYREKVGLLWQTCQGLGLELYVVGGVVRDLLLGEVARDPDVDGVVVRQGDCNALSVAKACQGRDPRIQWTAHEPYQTVTISWPDGIWIDLVTARTEFYPQPGANPQVSASDLGQDLGRRDFTVNALAIRLTEPEQGWLVDWHRGYEDVQRRQLRILHALSFVEDPTRIFRACRFVVRLGFRLEPWTAAIMQTTLSLGIHDGRRGYRLRRECEYLLQTPTWRQAFQVLAAWGAWRCLDPELRWHDPVIAQVVRVGMWTYHFAGRYGLSRQLVAQLRLEALLLTLPDALGVAAALQLPTDRLERMRQSQALGNCYRQWPASIAPSQVDHTLACQPVPVILLTTACAPPSIRRLLYCYLHTWRLTPTLLRGQDLKNLGIPPGPHYGQILQAVRAAQLDGNIHTREEALAWVQKFWQN
ncbi:MAG: hypothetical protein Q6K08_01615 [Thermostichales cyanobacterium GMQP_bins_62]